MYQLHPTLADDTFKLGQLDLCDVLVMNNNQYTWLILVPRRANICELYTLSEKDQQLLLKESSYIAKKLSAYSKADKINIASIGNIVSQLHVHIVARHKSDPVWPRPVWGNIEPSPYSLTQQKQLISQLAFLFSDY